MQKVSFLFKIGISLAILGLLLTFVQADEHEHHSRGSQGGNEDITGDIYKRCEEKKANCIGDSKACYKSKNCKIMVAISKDKDQHEYSFSLFGDVTPQGGYVGVGISEDGERMKDSVIFQCRSDKPDNLEVAWSDTGRRPQNLDNATNEFVGKVHLKESIGVYGGKLTCGFTIPAKFMVKNRNFDLDSKKYKILLAYAGFEQDGTTSYHKTNRYLSDYMHLYSKESSSNYLAPSTFLLLLPVYHALF